MTRAAFWWGWTAGVTAGVLVAALAATFDGWWWTAGIPVALAVGVIGAWRDRSRF
jgi:hypothetical protein